jgi:hypothetical protein
VFAVKVIEIWHDERLVIGQILLKIVNVPNVASAEAKHSCYSLVPITGCAGVNEDVTVRIDHDVLPLSLPCILVPVISKYRDRKK